MNNIYTFKFKQDGVKMTQTKIPVALMLSLLINAAIFMSFNTDVNQWQLSRSELNIGNSQTGVMEKVNLLVAPFVATNDPKAQAQQKKVIKSMYKPKPLLTTHNKQAPVLKPHEQVEEEKEHKSTPAAASAQAATASPQITQSARLISAPPALVYPAQAIKQNARGKVRVRAIIDLDGSVKNIEVTVSSGFSILDEEAVKWFSKLRFAPAQNGGEKVSSVVNQTISFTLNEDNSA